MLLLAAALIREQEHSTIEHLLVMPLSPAEIMLGRKSADTHRKSPPGFCGHPLDREENIHKRPVRRRKPVRWARKRQGGRTP